MKERLKYLPIHLFLGIPMFACVFIMLTIIIELELFKSLLLSLIFYIYDALLQAKLDYLESEIKRPKQ